MFGLHVRGEWARCLAGGSDARESASAVRMRCGRRHGSGLTTITAMRCAVTTTPGSRQAGTQNPELAAHLRSLPVPHLLSKTSKTRRRRTDGPAVSTNRHIFTTSPRFCGPTAGPPREGSNHGIESGNEPSCLGTAGPTHAHDLYDRSALPVRQLELPHPDPLRPRADSRAPTDLPRARARASAPRHRPGAGGDADGDGHGAVLPRRRPRLRDLLRRAGEPRGVERDRRRAGLSRRRP